MAPWYRAPSPHSPLDLPRQHVWPICLFWNFVMPVEGLQARQWWRKPVTALFALTLFLVTCTQLSTAVIVVPTNCAFGSNYVQVVAFVTIRSEELQRTNGTYNGITNANEGAPVV